MREDITMNDYAPIDADGHVMETDDELAVICPRRLKDGAR